MNKDFISPVSFSFSDMKKSKNILLIDNDEDCLYLTKHSLEKLNMFARVDTMTNGYLALEFMKDNCVCPGSEKCPDIIFVDNQMPQMDGFTFLERLNNIPGILKDNLQIYMVSSFTNDEDKERLKKYNIQGVINKPLSLEKLKVLFS